LWPGLHNCAGIWFVLVAIGAANARDVHTTATTRTIALTARFIHFLLTCGSPGSGNPSWEKLYRWCQVAHV